MRPSKQQTHYQLAEVTARCITSTVFGNKVVSANDHISIIGAGVAGLTCACELLDQGQKVTVYERSEQVGGSACSWYAGGMLAPQCERESAEAEVVELGQLALGWWQRHVSVVSQKGSLVLSPKRDRQEINRFARLTEQHRWLDGSDIEQLEPDLSGRFEQGLLFPEEAHLNPRDALVDLVKYIADRGGQVEFGQAVSAQDVASDSRIVIDCRGFAAKDVLSSLRGVKGEMMILHCSDIAFSRPIRLLHPRYPMYLVPREGGFYMLGATMIENDERHRMSVRSTLELLSAVYALHPGFAEAEVIEVGVDVRPSFNNNLPRIMRNNNIIYMNGLYRHGFLLGPAMAMQVAEAVISQHKFDGLPKCA